MSPRDLGPERVSTTLPSSSIRRPPQRWSAPWASCAARTRSARLFAARAVAPGAGRARGRPARRATPSPARARSRRTPYTELRTTAPTATPVLEGIALHEAVRPNAAPAALRLAWTGTVRAANRVVRRDGVVATNRAEQILAVARQAAQAAGHVLVRLPDGVVRAVAAVEVAAELQPEAGRD